MFAFYPIFSKIDFCKLDKNQAALPLLVEIINSPYACMLIGFN